MLKVFYDHNDIKKSLLELGIKKGSHIFIQSNIGGFGFLKNASCKEEYYNTFKKCLLNLIGKDGTLIFPTFSYSFMNGVNYDPNKSPTNLGVLSNEAIKDKSGIRSLDPNFSIVSFGGKSVYFTQNPDEHSFGESSFWKRFLDNDGIFLTFNLKNSFLTFRHYIEKKHKVKYRYDKPFSGFIIENNNKIQKRFYHYVRDKSGKEILPNRVKFHSLAEEMNFIRKSKLGRGHIDFISAKDAYTVGEIGLKKDPNFFINDTY